MKKRFFLFAIMLNVSVVAYGEGMPFDYHAPFEYGETYDGGGNGSYYNQGYHTGTSRYCIDFNQGNGDDDLDNPVTATAGGIIVANGGYQGYNTIYPDDVAIEHVDGYYSLYMHLDSNIVAGYSLTETEFIGEMSAVWGQLGVVRFFVEVYIDCDAQRSTCCHGFFL